MVVGTSAPRRRMFMFEAFGSDFEMHFLSPDIDEKKYRSDEPGELTRLVADAKMNGVLAKLEENHSNDVALLIRSRSGSVAVTFDQVVVWQNEIREKPESIAEARRFITCYSGSNLATVQTTCVHSFDAQARAFCPNNTMTYYRELPTELISRFVARGECLKTAGGFVVEDEDMQSCMIKIDPGTAIEVQGVSVVAVQTAMRAVLGSADLSY